MIQQSFGEKKQLLQAALEFIPKLHSWEGAQPKFQPRLPGPSAFNHYTKLTLHQLKAPAEHHAQDISVT